MKETNWIHIEFWFTNSSWNRSDATLSYEEQIKFERFLSLILLKCTPYFKRKFYLYEPNPHCFLALELKNRNLFPKIENQVNFVKEAYIAKKNTFIKKVELKRDTGDGNNRDGFIKILDAMADYQLLYQDNSLSHIIHCMMDTAGLTRTEENKLYSLMKKHYK